MATIPDSVKATLDAQWTAAGGAEPTYYVGEDMTYTNPPPAGQEYIWILSKDLMTDITPVNDTYATLTHRLVIIVNTATSGDRLKEIADEVERILNSVAITGANYQKITKRDLAPTEYLHSHQELMIVTIKSFLADSGIAYGATATTSFTTDELTVNTWLKLGRTVTAILDEDDMASDDDAALATQQSIKKYVDDNVTAWDTLYELDDTDLSAADPPNKSVLMYSGPSSAWKDETAETLVDEGIQTIDPVKLTGELDLTGVAVSIDMNPAHTTGADIINITPTAILSSGTWRGVHIDGGVLDPSAGGIAVRGLSVDLTGVSVVNNPEVTGLYLIMPNVYGGGIDRAAYFSGNGRSASLCTQWFAMEFGGDVNQSQGVWKNITSTKQAYFQIYNTKNDGNPYLIMGSGVGNSYRLQPFYNAGTQELDYLNIDTATASAVNTDGNIRFRPDGAETFRVNTAADTNQAKVTGNLEITGDIVVGGTTLTEQNIIDLLALL